MFDIIRKPKTRVPHKSLYCVWIQTRDGENAPLIRVWIDPSMAMFESGVKVHAPDVMTARAMIQATLNTGNNS